MTTWYILRHAEKEVGNYYNPHLRHQDQPISLKGQQNSHKLCPFFVDKDVSAIYVSAYQRTWQTIDYVAQQLNITPVIDERLNEIDSGEIDGMTDQEILPKYPDVWEAYLSRKADFRFPGGETGTEAQQRIVEFLQDKHRKHGSDNIIVVSHEGLIRLLMCYLVNMPVYQRGNFRLDLCGLMEISYQPNYQSWKLIRFNQVFQ